MTSRKGKFIYAIFWLLANHISQSLLATVSESCSDSEETAQCYTVSFTRSVFEGHDATITRDSSASSLLITIYSNTASTDMLKSYTVYIATSCTGTADFTIQQSAAQQPQECEVELTNCSSRATELVLKANSDTIKDDIFYVQIRLPLPASNFQLTVLPETDGDSEVQSSIPAPSDFTATGLNTIESTGQATNCSIAARYETGAAQGIVTGAIAAICVFSICLIAAAVAAKIYTYMDKIRPQKVSGASPEQGELTAIGSGVGETSGNYFKQAEF